MNTQSKTHNGHTIAAINPLNHENVAVEDLGGDGFVWAGYASGMRWGRFHITPTEARTFATQLRTAADAVEGREVQVPHPHQYTIYTSRGWGRGPTIAAALAMQERHNAGAKIERLMKLDDGEVEQPEELPPHEDLVEQLVEHAHREVWDAICALRVAARLKQNDQVIEHLAGLLDEVHDRFDEI